MIGLFCTNQSKLNTSNTVMNTFDHFNYFIQKLKNTLIYKRNMGVYFMIELYSLGYALESLGATGPHFVRSRLPPIFYIKPFR